MSDRDRTAADNDGGDAAPGDNPWVTRTSRASGPVRAPWERAGLPEQPDDETSGSHGGGGVTVAELIARLSGGSAPAIPDRAEMPAKSTAPRRRAAEPRTQEPPLAPPAPRAPRPLPESDPATEVFDAPLVALPDPFELPHATVRTDVRNYIDHPERPAHTDAPPPVDHHTRHRFAVAGRILLAFVAVVALSMTGAAWQWQNSKNHRMNKVSALDLNSRDIVDPNAQFGDENFLIVGLDSRFGENADMGAGTTADAGGTRSDTIMLVNIPASRKRVVAVSFPRDLAIKPLQCEAWDPKTGAYGPLYDDDTKSYGPDQVYTETKLNSAYAFGGPRCLVKEIQKLSGLSINRFMAVDFAGFSKLVDAVGGVEVCSKTPIEDYELGTVLEHSGRQTIDGHTALQYVRARQVTTEVNGDYGRIKRQQMFLSSLLRSMISKDTFFNLGKLNNVVNLFIEDSTVDNITTKELVQLGQSIQGVSAGRVTFVTIPTGVTDSEGNEPPRDQDMRALFDAIINDDPLPEERGADNTPVPATPATAPGASPGELVNTTTTDPSQVTVRVSNSTGQDGLAATATKELEQQGFSVTSPDDYQGKVESTTVFFSPGHEEAAATVASSLPGAHVEQVSGLGDVVRVVLGSDFSTVTAPAANGSAAQMHVTHGSLSGEPTKLPEDLSVTNAADTTCK
ncbi:LytR family transcriptional regulator [Mycobacterium sp. CBMA293]|uniref:LCP family protein n=1 Tax=unclassified Mycolicibacterium TaxID=2636767 RepID=UPI0013263165|nr:MULTISPECIES: LCP family protein [unclassified Mycolicibacterium]MUL47649.1 LytR family transcriptional regulator [Mycolicibacterium sp. CBMA 360]MUL92877.1 LytR family transcriptional regulator [Mycolicibacterium sp. CBMA 230]MUM32298.1 LytR family transcriptional regulator [Mycolicibacterium sp. CBMA 361]MUL61833.1 LytR family transcriptional regulator [Mycolicibacterium sp. CBMA 335]MUL70897.1 LytR family transcriptional regulator [Mycolicibacterium sp. CBMA 311]